MVGESILKPLQPLNLCPDSNPQPAKKKRNLPGTPDPEAEVIALSPRTLLATNRFLCEICGKGFQRDQNLQLHRRGHNLPWKLRQRSSKEPKKRVYVCPEKTCVHHNPARALGDLTGIKKHFCRKHGEKKWKCEKCSKRYAVQSDWKAHSKTCGTREYRCDCGTLFSRRDSFITHRAFCDALAEETARVSAVSNMTNGSNTQNTSNLFANNLTRSNILAQLPPVLKPNIVSREFDHQSRQQVSLWMNDHRTHNNEFLCNSTNDSGMNIIAQMNNAENLYGDHINACSNVQQLDSQLSWITGNKYSLLNTELTSNSLPISSNLKDHESSQSILASLPSMFSAQIYNRPTSVSDTSATALLQKAAQIGATTTTPFIQCYESPKFQATNINDSSKFEGSLSSNQQRNLDIVVNDFQASNACSDMYIARQQSQLKSDNIGGETRDFLGVGAQTLCQPSMNGWI